MGGTSFYDFSTERGKTNCLLQMNHHFFTCIARLKLLKLLRFFLKILFFTEMPSLIRKEEFVCEHCGTQVTRKNVSRHKNRCSLGPVHCSQCPNFSTLSQDNLNYHLAKKHSVPRPSSSYKCKLSHAKFPGFYASRQHRNTQHGKQIRFKASIGLMWGT